MTAYVLSLLLSLGTYAEDRAPELAAVKRAQLETLAESIATVTTQQRQVPPRELAALLVVLAWHETKLSLRIAEGRCKPHECDRGLARGVYQLHRRATMTDAEWDALLGTDRAATLAGTREIVRRVLAARKRCSSLEGRQDWAAMAFSSLAGRGCVGGFRSRTERVALFRKLLRGVSS